MKFKFLTYKEMYGLSSDTDNRSGYVIRTLIESHGSKFLISEASWVEKEINEIFQLKFEGTDIFKCDNDGNPLWGQTLVTNVNGDTDDALKIIEDFDPLNPLD